jgi:hypothetical protein
MLRFAEEIMLLLLDDDGGGFIGVPESSLQCALAGAVLMDLALENRIDTDPKQLLLIDATPVGDSLLDPTLARIAKATETCDARYWVERIAEDAGYIREAVLQRLIERGILQRREDRFLWVFRTRRYPMVDGKAEREVKLRIMEILFSDQIPTPRDVVIIGLAHACNLFEQILSAREVEHIAPRIDQVRRLDLISQAMAQAIADIEVSLALALHMPPYS